MGPATSEKISVYPDPSLSLTRTQMQRQVDHRQSKLSTEGAYRRGHVNTVNIAVDPSLHALWSEFSVLVNSTFTCALDNGTMLAMVTDTMERAAYSRLYLQNLDIALWKTGGVTYMVSDTVRI